VSRIEQYKGYRLNHYPRPAPYDTETYVFKGGEQVGVFYGIREARTWIDEQTGTPPEAPEQRKVKIKFDGREFELLECDSQRERTYRAERDVDWGDDKRGGMTLEECQAFANKVTRSAAWARLRKRHGYAEPKKERQVTVEQAPHGGATAYPGMWKIRIASGMMSRHVMLHELAHVVVGPRIGHHWPFCRAFTDLVARFMSPALAKELKAQMRKHRSRYAVPPPPLSEERRRQLAEQGAKALGLKLREDKP
jgi:hypothetical protein